MYPKYGQATSEDRLFIVCDGMGGHECGEVASQLVCDTLSQCIRDNWHEAVFTDVLFRNAFDETVKRLNEYGDESYKKMGTTLTFLCLHKGGATMAHIGDSRVYHIRPSESCILYKSRDHSLAYDLFMAGELSLEEMKDYPKKNIVTRALMAQMEEKPEADITHTTDIQEGDYFYLCSDGMLEQMSDSELLEILSSDKTDEEKAEQMKKLSANNQDNHSAILIHVTGVELEEGDDMFDNDEQAVRHNAMYWEKRSMESLTKDKNTRARTSIWPTIKVIVMLVVILSFLFIILVNR